MRIFPIIFLFTIGCAVCSGNVKPPFKVLYNNDFTNTVSGPEWTINDLKKSVDETADTGVEAHMLQPASTWVPWWQSKIYPMAEHYAWWESYFDVNIPQNPVQEYILKGGDPFKEFVRECNEKKLASFISVRINDAHHLPNVEVPHNKAGAHTICKFYAENPQYRLKEKWVQNWKYPQVREYKFSLIKEIIENYDIAGLELDFMRHPFYFEKGEVADDEKAKIMEEFVHRVRGVLDEHTQPGKHKWLSARIPNNPESQKEIGTDVAKFAKAGVDMFVLSPSYYTQQQVPVAEIRKMTPNAAIYLEVCHVVERTAYKKDPNFVRKIGHSYGDIVRIDRYTTDEEYYTAAHLAYSQGADGISAFNFVYYDNHIHVKPPFQIFKHIGDKDWVAKQPQHYIITNGYQEGAVKLLPQDLSKVKPLQISMYMQEVKGGWKEDGRLRIKTLPNTDLLEDAAVTASINGIELKVTDDISEPYKSPYPVDKRLALTPENSRAFLVPKKILKNGSNNIVFKTSNKKTFKIGFIDLAIK
jgi:hypothetical protein